MIKFQKNGEMFIAYEENVPQYGFFVEGNTLKKFVLLTDKMPNYVVLPNIYCEALDNVVLKDATSKFENSDAKSYVLKDSLKISYKCFKGRGNVVLNFLVDRPVIVEPNAFDAESKVCILTKSGYSLKTVSHHFCKGRFVCDRGYVAALPKNISGKFDYPDDEKLNIEDYNDKDLKNIFSGMPSFEIGCLKKNKNLEK